jgi:putative heme-binding domain-containing protein
MEALNRLKGVDLEKNPALKAAVGKIIESSRGTPEFIEISRTLNLTDADAEIIAIALREGAASGPAVDGIRFVLAHDKDGLVGKQLAHGDAAQTRVLIDLLGNAGEAAAVALLASVVGDAAREADLRGHAVRALARSEPGARELIATIAKGKMDATLQASAASALRVVPWPEVQAEAAKLLPTAGGPGVALAKLMAMQGDATRGAQQIAQTSCLGCHRIGAAGVDFGPALSEIGNKLSRDGLFAAILEPAASVSHGFDGWQLALKSGATRAGFIVSETANELSIKEPSGLISRVALADIATRTAIPGSMMPAGLEHTMTTQQLVDLVAYLMTLKPAP